MPHEPSRRDIRPLRAQNADGDLYRRRRDIDMKLNFWQILGLLLIIAAVVLILRREISPSSTPPPAATTGT